MISEKQVSYTVAYRKSQINYIQLEAYRVLYLKVFTMKRITVNMIKYNVRYLHLLSAQICTEQRIVKNINISIIIRKKKITQNIVNTGTKNGNGFSRN